eukprot:6130973-Pleurochrysis_carterae.AAC.2
MCNRCQDETNAALSVAQVPAVPIAAFRRACDASMARAGVEGDAGSARDCGTCGSPAVGSVAGMRLCKRNARPVTREMSAAGAQRQAS